MSSVEHPEYPAGVPFKFTPDGKVQPFPGNTIVAHVLPASPLYTSLLALYSGLEESDLSQLYTLLPPSSWHMTLFEGVCDQVRKPGFWPKDLPLSTPLADVTNHFRKSLEEFKFDVDAPPYELNITGYEPLHVGIGLHVEPATPEEKLRFKGARNRLSQALGMRFPQHDEYSLHISVAYLLRHLSPEQEEGVRSLLQRYFKGLKGAFELGQPEFCTFENMLKFDRVIFLHSSAAEEIED